MSLTELKKTIKTLTERPDIPISSPRRRGGLSIPDEIRLNDNITLWSEKKLITVKKKQSKKGTPFKINKFFMHCNLNKEEISEMIENLHDNILIIKHFDNTLKAKDIISCRNAETRRLLLDSYGYDRFVEELKGEVINREGSHELIRVEWHEDEEPIMMVRVKDSSTGAFYLLQVPPDMRICKEAVAWTFRMDVKEYDPIIET